MQKKLDLDKFLSDLNLKDELKVEEDLGSGYVKLKISEAERRQALQDINSVEDIIIELLRNSRDAGSKNIFLATKKIADKKRYIYCIDDGKGIPAPFHDLIFQSRVTSKLEDGHKDPYGFHGRGMALFSVKLNVEEVKIIFSEIDKGTCIFIELDLEKIPEKKDQSILPQITKKNGELIISGGVNNILKTIIDFMAENTGINFYTGSPTQIISTMRQLFHSEKETIKGTINDYDQIDELFLKSSLNISQLPSLTDNYLLMEKIVQDYFGMDISQRGLQRTIYGEIKPLNPLNSLFEFQDFYKENKYKNATDMNDDDIDRAVKKTISIIPSGRHDKELKLYDEIKLSNRFKDDEINYIIGIIKKEFDKIAKKYLLTIDKDVAFKKSGNTIEIKINIKQEN